MLSILHTERFEPGDTDRIINAERDMPSSDYVYWIVWREFSGILCCKRPGWRYDPWTFDDVDTLLKAMLHYNESFTQFPVGDAP